MWAKTSDYGSSSVRELNVVKQVPVENVRLVVDTQTGVLTGVVRNLGVSESVTIEVYGEGQARIRELYLGDEGPYQLGGLIPGLYRAVAATSMSRHISIPFEVVNHVNETVVDFDFLGPSSLHGTIVAAGRPVPNIQVSVLPTEKHGIGGKALSQEDGSYLIQDIDDGEYTVLTSRGRSYEIVVSGDTKFDIWLGELSFAGVIESELSTADMIVVLKSVDVDGPQSTSTNVDSLGKFRLDGLEVGSYQVRVYHDGEDITDQSSITDAIELKGSVNDYRIHLNHE